MQPAELAVLKSARIPGVPQFLLLDCGSAFRLSAECQFTGRVAVLHTQHEPNDADCVAVVRKLREG